LRIAYRVLRIGAFGGALVNGDVELASFGVEDDGEFADIGILLFDIISCVGRNYIQSVDRDDFCSVRKVHHFCRSYGDSQAREAAGTDGNINMLDVFWFSVELGQ